MPSGSRLVGPFGEAVAAILKDATHSRDTRLQVIGDHAGLSVAQVSRMLNGQKVITLDEYVSICESLKLDPEKVFAEARLAQTPTEAEDFDWDAEIARNLREREEAARILANYDLAAHNVDDSLDDDNANV